MPSPKEISQADRVNEWLVWLAQKSATEFDRVVDWASGTPTWRIAMREKCTPRTINNRIDRSLIAIIGEFSGQIIEIENIEEKHEHTLHFAEKPLEVISGEMRPDKVWSGTRKEFVVNGRRWRDGKERLRA